MTIRACISAAAPEILTQWVKRFIFFRGEHHAREMGQGEVESLNWLFLATRCKVCEQIGRNVWAECVAERRAETEERKNYLCLRVRARPSVPVCQ